MPREYFSDRERGPRPRVHEEIGGRAWGGIVAVIQSRMADDSFAYRCPRQCADPGGGTVGCDHALFESRLYAEVGLEPPLSNHDEIPTLQALDLIEFCHSMVAKAVQDEDRRHPFYGHYHLTFDRGAGQEEFREDINTILSRNQLAYELQRNGEVIRLGPTVLREALGSATFETGDTELDSLLESAREKFLSPDPEVRQEALEKLWDAWERLKTLEPGDKKASATSLLNEAAKEPRFREALESEAKELTRIGNTFRIRHSETTQVPLATSEDVDYLFHRMFALIRLLLRKTGRGG